MISQYKPQDLIAFEKEVVNKFENKEILAPIHLYNGNEEQIIQIFDKIEPRDWVFCSWRSHYQCLLKGVPPQELMSKILEGKSITLSFPKYKVYSSAIVGGIIPIALGVAYSNKLLGNNERCWVFSGDMTAETGIWYECYKYAHNHKLPISFVIEDNNKSVCTPTHETWGGITDTYEFPNVFRYCYESKYPHAGGLKRVQF